MFSATQVEQYLSLQWHFVSLNNSHSIMPIVSINDLVPLKPAELLSEPIVFFFFSFLFFFCRTWVLTHRAVLPI